MALPNRANKRIALANPFPDESLMYVELLERDGFEVRVVPTELQPALAAITRDPPHVVITRIRPWRFGIELISALKLQPATAHVRTMALSTSILSEVRDQAWVAGADAVVLLPTDPDCWLRIVHALAGPLTPPR